MRNLFLGDMDAIKCNRLLAYNQTEQNAHCSPGIQGIPEIQVMQLNTINEKQWHAHGCTYYWN